jgi:hypothetical protein
LISAAFAGSLAAGFVQNAVAHNRVDCDVMVTGQNDPAVDAAAVSAAVNSPDLVGDVTVCLAGTFDFGPAPPQGVPPISVAIVGNASMTSLRIVGLNNHFRRPATIRRGIQALTLTPAATLPKLAIENLRFEQPTFSAVSILRSNEEVRISDLQIAGVETHTITITPPPPPIPNPPPPQPITLRLRQGIAVTAAAGGNIAGDIVISNNVVNGGTYGLGDSALLVGSGIVLVGPLVTPQPPPLPATTFSAKVRIANNRILNWAGAGVLATGLIGDATIEENWVEPGAFARLVPGPACTTPNAEGAASGISLGGVVNSTVRDNVIHLVSAFTDTGAPAACTAGLLVRGVNVSGASGNIFFGNRIRGDATYAMVVGLPAPTVPPFPPSSFTIEMNNLFAFNWVFGFTGTNATLFIGSGATANAFIGMFPEIEGNTAGNWVLNR